MKKQALLFLIIAFSYVSFSSHSTGPSSTPAGVNTAKQGCSGTGCHSSTSLGATIRFMNIIEEGEYTPAAKYKPGGKYIVSFNVSQTPQQQYRPTFGYIMLATDASNKQAGTWSNPIPGYVKVTTIGQYQVAEHPTPQNVNGTTGYAQLGAEWTAPPAGKGRVTISLVVLLSNNNSLADDEDRWVRLTGIIDEWTTSSLEDGTNKADLLTAVYPNPATNMLHVNIQQSTSDKYHYSIYSINGVLATQGHLNNNVNNIDVSSLASGTHFISVTNGIEQQVITFNKL